MHKIKEWQLFIILLIVGVLLISMLSFKITSCDVIAVDNQLRIMENEVDTNIMLHNGDIYTIKWYNIFNKTFKTTIKKVGD